MLLQFARKVLTDLDDQDHNKRRAKPLFISFHCVSYWKEILSTFAETKVPVTKRPLHRLLIPIGLPSQRYGVGKVSAGNSMIIWRI